MKTLVFEQSAIKHNLSIVRQKAGKSVIYGVLTGDGHGTGVVELARILREEGIARFAVSEVAEAEAIRKAGMVECEILMLRSLTDPEEVGKLLDIDVVCTIGSTESGMVLNSVAQSRATVAEAHIQLDTGMGFGGLFAEETEQILSLYRNLPHVAISGIYTQIQAGYQDSKRTKAQLSLFDSAISAVQTAGFETGLTHAAGSYALLHCSFAHMGGVRASSVILGRCGRSHDDNLQKVGYGQAELSDVRWVPKGHTVGKESLVTLKKPTRVAILPVGYQNGFGVSRPEKKGFWRTLFGAFSSHTRTVRIGGQKVRILGGIGAMETLLDVTQLKCTTGDVARFDIDPLYAKGFTKVFVKSTKKESSKS